MMTPEECSAIAVAAEAATVAHRHQLRKDGVTPKIVHPARVAALVRHFGGSPDAVITAWLHDVIEDCGDAGRDVVSGALAGMQLSALRKERIAEMIGALTMESAIKDRERRHEDSYKRIFASPPEALLVKLCDRIDNLIDARERDKSFRQRTDESTGRLVEVLGGRARESGYGDALALLETMRECLRKGNSR